MCAARAPHDCTQLALKIDLHYGKYTGNPFLVRRTHRLVWLNSGRFAPPPSFPTSVRSQRSIAFPLGKSLFLYGPPSPYFCGESSSVLSSVGGVPFIREGIVPHQADGSFVAMIAMASLAAHSAGFESGSRCRVLSLSGGGAFGALESGILSRMSPDWSCQSSNSA